jgi:hypothetical protein
MAKKKAEGGFGFKGLGNKPQVPAPQPFNINTAPLYQKPEVAFGELGKGPFYGQEFTPAGHDSTQQPPVNWAKLLSYGLVGADAIIPGQPITPHYQVPTQQGYNPNPYGTGSQAIMEAGGDVEAKSGIHIKKSKRGSLHKALGIPEGEKIPASKLATHKGDSPAMKKKKNFARNANKWSHEAGGELEHGGDLKPAKAREMLHNPPGGKKLTEKQRKYFGWVASKAFSGLSIEGDPVQKPTNAKQTAGVYNPTSGDLDNIEMSELISYNLVNGGSPLGNIQGRDLFRRASDKFGKEPAQQLINEIGLFNQDGGNAKLAPEERINRYFSLPQNKEVKQSLNRYGYGPSNIYNTSSNVMTQQQQGRGLLTKMDAGGSVKQLSHNPIDGGTHLFEGASHENGGIDISYGGNQVEVEGQETATMDDEGNLNIMGNMTVPGTNTKFKQVSKTIAKQENKYTRLLNKGQENYDVEIAGQNKFDRLKAATGKIMMQGANQGFRDLAQKKQYLSTLQSEILDEAEQKGLDPISYSEGGKKKAKNGAKLIMAAGGDPGPKKKKKNNIQDILDSAKFFTDPNNNTVPGRLVDDGPGLTSWGDTFPTKPVNISEEGGEDFLNSIKRKIGDAESSGRYDIASSVKGSSAYGKYQFTKATRKGIWASNFKDEYPTFEAYDKAYKSTPQVQEQTMDARINSLRAKYGDDPTAIALVHRLGEGGYNKVKNNPDALNSSISKSIAGSSDKETPNEYLRKIVGNIPKTVNVPNPVGNIPVPTKIADTEYTLSNRNITPETPIAGKVDPGTVDPLSPVTLPQRRTLPSDVTALSPLQILPEIIQAAKNKPRPVPLQSYNPQLLSDYEISLQDRRNNNTSTFNAIQRQLGQNPTALSSFAAQKYEADNSVNAEEFHINQGNQNQITNQNLQTLNEAQFKNLGLADEQYTRQDKALSNVQAKDQMIMQSVASKVLQHDNENRKLGLYENLYDFRFDHTTDGGLQANYYGDDATWDMGGGQTQTNSNARTTKEYDSFGNLKRTRVTQPSATQTQKEQLQIQNLQGRTPLLRRLLPSFSR